MREQDKDETLDDNVDSVKETEKTIKRAKEIKLAAKNFDEVENMKKIDEA